MRRAYWVMDRVEVMALQDRLNNVAGEGWEVVEIIPHVTYAKFVSLVLTKEMSIVDYGEWAERGRVRVPTRDAGWEC